MKKALVLLSVLILLAACSKPKGGGEDGEAAMAAASGNAGEQKSSVIAGFFHSPVTGYGIGSEKDFKSGYVETYYGKPRDIVTKEIPNRNLRDTNTKTLTYLYKGMEFTWLLTGDRNEVNIVRKYGEGVEGLSAGVSVGMSRAAVAGLFGEPDEAAGPAWIYYVKDDSFGMVKLEFSGDNLASVSLYTNIE